MSASAVYLQGKLIQHNFLLEPVPEFPRGLNDENLTRLLEDLLNTVEGLQKSTDNDENIHREALRDQKLLRRDLQEFQRENAELKKKLEESLSKADSQLKDTRVLKLRAETAENLLHKLRIQTKAQVDACASEIRKKDSTIGKLESDLRSKMGTRVNKVQYHNRLVGFGPSILKRPSFSPENNQEGSQSKSANNVVKQLESTLSQTNLCINRLATKLEHALTAESVHEPKNMKSSFIGTGSVKECRRSLSQLESTIDWLLNALQAPRFVEASLVEEKDAKIEELIQRNNHLGSSLENALATMDKWIAYREGKSLD